MTLKELLKKTTSERFNLFLLKCNSSILGNIVELLKGQNVQTIDVGFELSKSLTNTTNAKFISIDAQESLMKLIDGVSPSGKKIVAIYNLGILLEPILKLNPEQILKDISKTKYLIIIWDNEVENNILHWSAQKEKYKFDFSDIDLKQIEIENEV